MTGIEGSRPQVDPQSESSVSIDTVHMRVHQGVMFSTSAINLALADDGNLDVLIVVGGTVHLRGTASINGDATVQLFEGTTVSANGSALPIINRNRIAPILQSTCLCYQGPTVTDPGVGAGGPTYLPGGQKNQSGAFSAEIDNEFILAPSTAYLARLTNLSGQARIASLELVFYEPGLL